MRKSLLALFAVALLVVVAVPIVDVTNAESNDNLQFYGQISHGSKPMPSPNVMDIRILHLEGKDTYKEVGKYTGKLNDYGEFTISVDNVDKESTYYITFKEGGYGVLSTPECLVKDEKTGYYKIDFSKTTMSGINTCKLTTEGHYITMYNSYGTLKGKILSSTGSHPYLNGVRVTITSTNTNEEHTVFTHGDGTFYFDNIGTGTYTLVAESKGFESVTEKGIAVNTGENKLDHTIFMTPTNDLDSSHWMTLIGIVAALLLLLGVIIHIVRVKNKKSSHE